MGLSAVAQLTAIASIAFAVYRRWKQYVQHRVWMILGLFGATDRPKGR
jgi:hypothetical protein